MNPHLNPPKFGKPKLFDREPLFEELIKRGQPTWAKQLRDICNQRLTTEAHGNMPRWTKAWQDLPEAASGTLKIASDAVYVDGTCALSHQEIQQLLMQFHPWRKGPFNFFGMRIDTEWRSDFKWERFADEIDFAGKLVLDVGCGNGYYGWRMIDAGAEMVLGCDPFPLYQMQFEVFRRYAQPPQRHFLLPIADHELPTGLHLFDLTLSMGVLYHRTSPIDHLQTLWQTLKPGGQLVLETLIIETLSTAVLVPEDRYAKMRNVWFIPSLSMLELWLRRSGFTDIATIDVSKTTTAEQRKTAWMTFESLEDFLERAASPHTHCRKTVEGYPAPVRAIVSAKRK